MIVPYLQRISPDYYLDEPNEDDALYYGKLEMLPYATRWYYYPLFNEYFEFHAIQEWCEKTLGFEEIRWFYKARNSNSSNGWRCIQFTNEDDLTLCRLCCEIRKWKS